MLRVILERRIDFLTKDILEKIERFGMKSCRKLRGYTRVVVFGKSRREHY